MSNALLAVSPTLSTLHTSRTVALHPEVASVLHPTHCPKCGTYRFSGDRPAHPTSTRKKRKRATSSRSKSLQLKCHLCDFSIDLPFNNSSLPTQSPRTENDTGPESTIAASPTPFLPGRRSHPKSNPTKTSTLKDLLSRNRQREEGMRAHKKRQDHDGLVTFLKEL